MDETPNRVIGHLLLRFKAIPVIYEAVVAFMVQD
jgi:hypothetical protein